MLSATLYYLSSGFNNLSINRSPFILLGFCFPWEFHVYSFFLILRGLHVTVKLSSHFDTNVMFSS
ncbi:unnamed protein product, partial [Brassica rapa subsp. trilocularis]